MNILYLDLFSGISGDMFIGALLDLGLDFSKLKEELGKLNLEGYHLHSGRSHKGSIAGTKFDVHLGDHHHHHEATEAAHAHSHQHPHTHEHEHSHHHGHADHAGHSHDDQRTFLEI